MKFLLFAFATLLIQSKCYAALEQFNGNWKLISSTGVQKENECDSDPTLRLTVNSNGTKVKSLTVVSAHLNFTWDRLGKDGKAIGGCSGWWPGDSDSGKCSWYMERYDVVNSKFVRTNYNCYDKHCNSRDVDYWDQYELNEKGQLVFTNLFRTNSTPDAVCIYERY